MRIALLETMTIITYDDLERVRKEHPHKRIVFCSGTFDLTHAGHVLFFEDAKALGDILVVAVGDDATIHEYKGPLRPYQNEHIRLKMVDSFKPVDFVLLDTPRKVGEKELFSPLSYIFERLKPDVYAVNEDGFGLDKVEAVTKVHGVKLVVLKRTCPKEFGNISTTSLVKKIREQ